MGLGVALGATAALLVPVASASAPRSVVTVAGRATAGGCSFRTALRLPAGASWVRADEVSFDATACTMRLAVRSGGRALPATSTAEWKSTAWYGSAGVKQAQDIVKASWTFDGSSASDPQCVFTRKKAAAWKLQPPYQTCGPLGLAQILAASETDFTSRTFCPVRLISIQVADNEIDGNPDGSATQVVQHAAVGAPSCLSLLTFHQSFKRIL
jgi:hypothetical protein